MKTSDNLPKLIASDIGGTLIRGTNIMPDFTASVLNRLKKKDVPVALITGFNRNTTLEYTANLDKSIILMPQNGTMCIKGGEMIWEYHIDNEMAGDIYRCLEKNNHPIIVYKGNKGGFNNYSVCPDDFFLSDAFQRVPRIDEFDNITGISTVVPNDIAQDTRTKLLDIIGDKFKLIYVREETHSWLEILHPEIRKDLALKRLCKEMAIPVSQVTYFGDNFNDLEVLRMVGNPVLVENAQPELKEEFKTVIRPVTEEGVARYLNDMFDLNFDLSTIDNSTPVC